MILAHAQDYLNLRVFVDIFSLDAAHIISGFPLDYCSYLACG